MPTLRGNGKAVEKLFGKVDESTALKYVIYNYVF